MAQNNIIVVDIETTGFSPKTDLIVEIGIVKVDLDNGTIETLFDSAIFELGFMKTHEDSWVFKNSTLLPEDVYNAPSLVTFQDYIQNDIFDNPEYLGVTAYNRSFDIGFFLARGFKFQNLLPCPMIESTNVLKLPSKNGRSGFKWPSAQEAWNYFYPDISYTEEHRALKDAIMEGLIVYKMYKQGFYSITPKTA